MSPPWKSAALAAWVLAVLIAPSLNAADTNEVRNGDFNQGLVKWDTETFLDHTQKPANRRAFAIVADGSAEPDLKVLEITLSPQDYCTISQKFVAPSKRDYIEVSFRYKVSSDFKTLDPYSMNVAVMGAVHPEPLKMWARVIPGAPWQVFSTRYSRKRSAPTTVKISVRAGTGKVLIDDIKVTGEENFRP